MTDAAATAEDRAAEEQGLAKGRGPEVEEYSLQKIPEKPASGGQRSVSNPVAKPKGQELVVELEQRSRKRKKTL